MPDYARRFDRFDRPIHRVRQRSRSLSPLPADTPTGPSRETKPSKRLDAARELPANTPRGPSRGDSRRAISDSFRPSGMSPSGTVQSLGAPRASVSEIEHGSKRRRLPDSYRHGPTRQDSYNSGTGLMDSYRPDTAQRQPEEAKVKNEPSEDRSLSIDVHGSSIQYEKTPSSYDQPRQKAAHPMQTLPQAALLNETAYTDRPVAMPVSRTRIKHLAVLKQRQFKLEHDIFKAIAAGVDEQSSVITGSRRVLSALTQELHAAQRAISLGQASTSKVQQPNPSKVAASKVQQSNPSKRAHPQRIQDVEHRIFKLEQNIAEVEGEPDTAAILRSKRFLVITRQELRDLENGKKVPMTPRLRTPRERYEDVRKMEQRQAQKNLKVLRGHQRTLPSTMSAVQRSLFPLTRKPEVPSAGSDDEEDGGVKLSQTLNQQHSALLIQANDLKQALHAAEVDNMYCANSPRNQPYICLFEYRGESSKDFRKAHPEISNWIMEIEHDADIIRTTTGNKPPFWYEVEKRMRDGKLQEKAASELNSMNQMQMPVVGGKVDAVERSMDGMNLKRKHDWTEEEEIPVDMLDEDDEEEDDDENNEDDEDDEYEPNKL